MSTWFIAIHAPLRIDETGSYWQISKGFSEIVSRQGSLSFPAYSYILWFSTKIIGTSEIALRVPSILAMMGAVYLLYLAARRLFERDIAFIAAVIFCLDPIVVFASIDIRPYAFGVLATNAAILVLLRLRRSSSNWLAALFGLTAALIVWFHFLFGVILPPLVLCFIAFKFRDRKTFWKQFIVASGAFALAFLPVIPGLIDMLRTSKTHVYEPAPNLSDLAMTLAPGWLFIVGRGIRGSQGIDQHWLPVPAMLHQLEIPTRRALRKGHTCSARSRFKALRGVPKMHIGKSGLPPFTSNSKTHHA
jgi:hypothetical protein